LGCCTGCASSLLACPPGLGYFIHLFGIRLQALLENIVIKTKPKLIMVCMIYFLDEKITDSWANTVLSILGYNANPGKLQELIRKIYMLASKNITIAGSKVVAVPLFEALDGKDSKDYCQRVEPSPAGGVKMAKLIVDTLIQWENESSIILDDSNIMNR
jgi:hypothetical protein